MGGTEALSHICGGSHRRGHITVAVVQRSDRRVVDGDKAHQPCGGSCHRWRGDRLKLGPPQLQYSSGQQCISHRRLSHGQDDDLVTFLSQAAGPEVLQR